MRNRCSLTAWILVFAIAGVGHAEVAVDERNLAYGSEVVEVTLGATGESVEQLSDVSELALFAFPSDLSTVVASQGFVDEKQVGFFFSKSNGHSVLQEFVGDPTVTSYQLNVDVLTNTLASESVMWEVRINSVKVDEFEVDPGFVGTVSTGAIFSEISGPVYTVELVVAGDVSPGGGSHSLRYAGDGANKIRLSGPDPTGAVICLDAFCDTLECDLDNGEIVTCAWNWTCTGSDDQPMIGAKHGSEIAIGGAFNGETYGWDLDVPTLSFNLLEWDGIGQSSLLVSGTFTINTCNFARSGESIFDSVR